MAVTVVIEDGTGVVGANVYEAVADAESVLSDFGYTGFSSLADEDTKAAYLVRGTRSVNLSLLSQARGIPKDEDQGLYYPRSCFYLVSRFVDSYEVPADVLLASRLKAEFLAQRDGATNDLAGIPAGVTKVEFAHGVRVEKEPGVLRSPSLADIQLEVVSLIDTLTSFPVAPAALAWGV